MPQPFEVEFGRLADVNRGKAEAIADWNLRRSTFASFACNQLMELFSEDMEKAKAKLESAVFAEKYEILSRKMVEDETGQEIDLPYELPGLQFRHPYDEISPEIMFQLMGEQILEFAKLTFSKSRFSLQKKKIEEEGAGVFAVLNRYRLTTYANTPFKGVGPIFTTVMVRLIDTIRILKSRREIELSSSATDQIEKLISRDIQVIGNDEFKEITKSWSTSTLINIHENFGKFIGETLATATPPEILGNGPFSWISHLPISLQKEIWRRGESEKRELAIIDAKSFEKINTFTEYRERIIDIFIAMASDSHLGIGNFDFISKIKDESQISSSGRRRIKDNYNLIANILKGREGSTKKKWIQCGDFHMADAIIKSWDEQGVLPPAWC